MIVRTGATYGRAPTAAVATLGRGKSARSPPREPAGRAAPDTPEARERTFEALALDPQLGRDVRVQQLGPVGHNHITRRVDEQPRGERQQRIADCARGRIQRGREA